jgi:hypothetical protein
VASSRRGAVAHRCKRTCDVLAFRTCTVQMRILSVCQTQNLQPWLKAPKRATTPELSREVAVPRLILRRPVPVEISPSCAAFCLPHLVKQLLHAPGTERRIQLSICPRHRLLVSLPHLRRPQRKDSSTNGLAEFRVGLGFTRPKLVAVTMMRTIVRKAVTAVLFA